MRVMLLTADYPPHVWSGIGVAVQRQARALSALGVHVTVLVASPDAARTWPEADGDVEVRSLAGRRFPVDPRGFDWVHLHSLPLAELAFELRHRFELPLVYTAHALVHRESRPSEATAFWSAVQRRVLERSQRVVFLSESERAAALDLLPMLWDRAVVVPNGLPMPAPGASSASLDGPLVFAGRFAESKGLETLAGAMEQVFAEHPTARLVLAGGHGDAAGRRAVSRMQHAHPDRCQVLGWLDQRALGELLATASLALVPSLYEPFGQVALEAMSLGTPVLASAVGGLLQVVGPESGGHLVASHAPGDWARETLGLLRDSAEHERLRQRGPRYVAARFEIGAVAERLVKEAYAA